MCLVPWGSFFTGQEAADAVLLPAAANPILTEHADWAKLLVWFFGIYALIRVADLWRNAKPKSTFWWPLALIGIVGLFLVYQTGERGAQMVFEHGVGVQVTSEDAAPKLMISGESGLTVESGLGWIWKPISPSRWDEGLSWLEGNRENITVSIVGTAERSDVLSLEISGETLLLVVDDSLQNVQIDFGIDLSKFAGELTLLHNFQDAQNHMFMKLAGGKMQQGSLQDGNSVVHDDKPFEATGWLQLRVVADRTHFRAYSGRRMVTHGHGAAPLPGKIGFRLEGSGVVLIDNIQAQIIEH